MGPRGAWDRDAWNRDIWDEPARDDAWEPTYPDGSVKHECWDSRSLPKAAPREPRDKERPEDGRED